MDNRTGSALAGPDVLAPTPSRGRRWARRIGRALLVLLVLAVIGVGALVLWARALVRGSLPQLDGELRLAGLSAEVRVERDGLGVPTVRGHNRADVAFATGFVHGQERYFQMDLMRRHAAGELAELIGPGLVAEDSRVRLHRFRDVARRALENFGGPERAAARWRSPPSSTCCCARSRPRGGRRTRCWWRWACS